MEGQFHHFKIVGGPHDGETVEQLAFWNGRAWCPAKIVHRQIREPLPRRPVKDIPLTQAVNLAMYHRWTWQDDNHRWYDYRPERPEN